VPDSGQEVFLWPESWAAYCARTEHLAGPHLSWARPQTGARKYHNQTIHGPFREAQLFLNLKLRSAKMAESLAPR
jgi:hypothetical protein